MLRKAMENDGHVEGKAIRKEDTDGRLCKLTLWTHNECENTYNMCELSISLAFAEPVHPCAGSAAAPGFLALPTI